MKNSKVKKLKVLDRLAYFIHEREAIRERRMYSEADKPWTDDEVLQNWRFCNIRRMDDTVSSHLLTTWYTPHKDHPRMLPAVALARLFNLPRTLDAIKTLVFAKRWQPEKISETLRKLKAGGTIFNPAYMVRGNDGVDKVETVIQYTVQPLIDEPVQIDSGSMQRTWRHLLPRYGMGSFMAGQVVADLRWAVTGTWADRDTWAPMGPGSRKGLARVMYGPLLDCDWEIAASYYHQDTFLNDLRSLVNNLRQRLSNTILDKLEMMDYQNICCEFFKYEKVLWGEGRAKQRYPGVN